MAQKGRSGDRVTKVLRWAARAIGSVVAGFWVMVGSLDAFVEPEPWTLDGFVMAALIVASAVSIYVAWRREGLGGLLVLACGVAHSVLALIESTHNRGVAVMLAGGPLLIAGILFLASWWRQRSERA